MESWAIAFGYTDLIKPSLIGQSEENLKKVPNEGENTLSKYPLKTRKLIFDYAQPFHNGLAPIKINGKWGFRNGQFDIAIPALFDWADKILRGNGDFRPKRRTWTEIWFYRYKWENAYTSQLL